MKEGRLWCSSRVLALAVAIAAVTLPAVAQAGDQRFRFEWVGELTFVWNQQSHERPELRIPVRFHTDPRGLCRYRFALSRSSDAVSSATKNGSSSPHRGIAAMRWQQGGRLTGTVSGSSWTEPLQAERQQLLSGNLVLEWRQSWLQTLPSGRFRITLWLVAEVSGVPGHADYRVCAEVNIILTVPPQVQISGLNDMTLRYRDAGHNWLWQDTHFCVFASDGWYRVELDGHNNPGRRFLLTSRAGYALPYRLSFRTAHSHWLPVTQGGELWGRYQGHPLPGCGGENNATLRVEIETRNLYSVPVDAYSDILTLTVRAY